MAGSSLGDAPQRTMLIEGDALDARGHGITLFEAATGRVEPVEKPPADVAPRNPQLARAIDRSALPVSRYRDDGGGEVARQRRAVSEGLDRGEVEFEDLRRPVFLITADPDRAVCRSRERAFEPAAEREDPVIRFGLR